LDLGNLSIIIDVSKLAILWAEYHYHAQYSKTVHKLRLYIVECLWGRLRLNRRNLEWIMPKTSFY